MVLLIDPDGLKQDLFFCLKMIIFWIHRLVNGETAPPPVQLLTARAKALMLAGEVLPCSRLLHQAVQAHCVSANNE